MEEPRPVESGSSRRVVVVAIALAVVVAAYLLLGGGGVRRSDLDLLPANTAFVLVMDAEEILSSSLGETVRDVFAGPWAEFEEEMRREVGLGPDDVRHLVFGGDVASPKPIVIVVLEDSIDDDQLARIAQSLRIRSEGPRDVDGHRVWGDPDDRMALGRVRGDTLIIGPTFEVEASLRGRRGRSELVELLVAEAGLDASLAMAFDWSAIMTSLRGLDRDFRELLPVLARRIGPVVVRADVGSGTTATAKLFDGNGDVAATYSAEVDGGFLEGLLTDLGRLAKPRRRPPDDFFEPEPARVAPVAEPEPASDRRRR